MWKGKEAMPLSDGQEDWEVTSSGLYIATRRFLLRRGYCCANRCLNCPYVNWREQLTWQHAPGEVVQRMRVSPKALCGVRAQLARHEQELEQCRAEERTYHLEMIAHYSLLLTRWH